MDSKLLSGIFVVWALIIGIAPRNAIKKM